MCNCRFYASVRASVILTLTGDDSL